LHSLRALALSPLLVVSACTSDDLAAFSEGLAMYNAEMEARLHAPCPFGMYRQYQYASQMRSYDSYYSGIPPTYAVYPDGSERPVSSYCVYLPVVDDDDRYGHGDDRRLERAYREGYRDGVRDQERDGGD
jgi:hypothetical protein